MSRSERQAAICPCTGLTIPECSCRRCIEEQVRNFSPLVRSRLHAVPPEPPRVRHIEPPEDGRAAA